MVKQRFFAFAAATALTAFSLLSLVAVADPHEDLGTGIIPPLKPSEVPPKIRVAQQATDVDVVLVGSSHLMFTRPSDLEPLGIRSINLAFPGATPTETLAMERIVYPRAPDADYIVTLDQLVYAEFFDHNRMPPRPADDPVDLYVEAAKLSSVDMLQKSARGVVVGTLYGGGKPLWRFDDAGGPIKAPRFPFQLSGTDRDNRTMELHNQTHIRLMDEATGITEHEPIRQIARNLEGNNVTFVRYPWNPGMPEAMFHHPRWVQAGQIVDDLVQDVCALGAHVVDLRDWLPDVDSPTNGWVDADHLGPEASFQAFEAILAGEHHIC